MGRWKDISEESRKAFAMVVKNDLERQWLPFFLPDACNCLEKTLLTEEKCSQGCSPCPVALTLTAVRASPEGARAPGRQGCSRLHGRASAPPTRSRFVEPKGDQAKDLLSSGDLRGRPGLKLRKGTDWLRLSDHLWELGPLADLLQPQLSQLQNGVIAALIWLRDGDKSLDTVSSSCKSQGITTCDCYHWHHPWLWESGGGEGHHTPGGDSISLVTKATARDRRLVQVWIAGQGPSRTHSAMCRFSVGPQVPRRATQCHRGLRGQAWFLSHTSVLLSTPNKVR